MEKYSVFTEKSSGINPFYLPPYAPSLAPSALLLSALRALPALLLLCLLLPLEALAVGVEGASLAAGAALRQGLARPLAWLLLRCLGLSVGLQEARKESLALRPPPARAAGAEGSSASGELLLVNACSYLDPLVLLAVKGAGLAQLSRAGTLVRVPLWRALQRSFRAGGAVAPAAPSAGGADARALLATPWAALAVQPEGAPTNGRAFLSLGGEALGALGSALAAAPLPGNCPTPRLRLLALHYSSAGDAGRFSPCFLGQCSPWWHAACLLTHAGSSAAAAHALPLGFDPLPSDFAPPARSAEWPLAISGGWEQLLRRFNVRSVGADAAQHARFLAMALEHPKAA